MASPAVQVRQLAHRLESTSSAERIEALGDLQTLARSDPATVGEQALLKSFKILREQSNPEEYAEALDLASRLISCQDKNTARSNSQIILSDGGNVELLLELLEHEDMTVGVMASQILTELHVADGGLLESRIQDCPDGMIKLLQRLPDSSREEVRNQAIVLIQQLTFKNEELMKTVVFNEGFEILFRIISEEGGYGDAGLVVSDCLRICANLLSGSETCQRLFFAMGSSWILTLAEFFNPVMLENPDKQRSSLVDAEDVHESGWFDQPNRLPCAVLALTALAHSLHPCQAKHQRTILETAPSVIASASFWIARGGPSELLGPALSVLMGICSQNVQAAAFVATNVFVKVPPVSVGKTIPAGVSSPSLNFGWRPLPHDDCRFISLLALLAERFVHPAVAWDPPGGRCLDFDLQLQVEIQRPGSEGHARGVDLAQACMDVFAGVLAADSSVSDIMIQFVLAPPPPPMIGDADEMDAYGGSSMRQQLDTMRPVCAILVGLVVQVCEKSLSTTHVYGGMSHANVKPELDIGERALNLLSVVFLNGSQVARELMTAISTVHLQQMVTLHDAKTARGLDHHEHKPILTNLLASVGKAARLPGGSGYQFLSSLLQLLAIVVNGCERAACQVFEDPANLFVVDLASSSSELAGVPANVQFAVCFFLGCCFMALPKDRDGNDSGSGEGSVLQRKNFLSMLESKLTLNRFNDSLRRPLALAKKHHTEVDKLPPFAHYFALPGFKQFYLAQVEAIKGAIFELYSGVDSADGADSVQQQIIQMQQEKIKELEARLNTAPGSAGGIPPPPTANPEELATLLEQVEQKERQLVERQRHEEILEEQSRGALAEAEAAREYAIELERSLNALRDDYLQKDAATKELERKVDSLQNDLSKLAAARTVDVTNFLVSQDKLTQAVRRADEFEAKCAGLLDELSRAQPTPFVDEEAHQDEVLRLKEMILAEAAQRHQLEETNSRNERKLQMLQSELMTLRNCAPPDDVVAKMSKELAAKEEATQQLSEALADAEAVREDARKVEMALHLLLDAALQDLLPADSSVFAANTTELTAEFEGWTVKQLKDKLRELKLPVSGNKGTLVDRLVASAGSGLPLKVQRVLDCIEELKSEVAAKDATVCQLAADLDAAISSAAVADQKAFAKSPHATLVDVDSAPLATAVDDLLAALTSDEAEVLQPDLDLLRLPQTASPDSFASAVVAVLGLCRSAISATAGECSDVAEGAQLLGLEGAEGSLERVVACCRRLRERLFEVDHVADSAARFETHAAALEQELNRAEEERLAMLAKMQELEFTIDEQSTALEQANARVAMAEAISLDTSQADEAIDMLRAQLAAMHLEKTKLIDEHASAEAAAENTYAQQAALAREDLDALQVQLAAAEATVEDLAQSRGQLENQVLDLSATLATQRESAAAEVKRLQQAVTDLSHNKDEAAQHLTKEMWQLRDELAAAKQHAQALEAQLKDHGHYAGHAQAELTQALQAKDSELEHLKLSYVTAQQQLEAVRGDVVALNVQVATATATIAALEAQAQQEVTVLSQRAAEQQQQLDVAHADASAFREREGLLLERVAVLESQLEDLNSSRTEDLTSAAHTLMDLRQQRNGVEEALAIAQEEVATLTQRVAELEHELSESADALSRAESQVESLEQTSLTSMIQKEYEMLSVVKTAQDRADQLRAELAESTAHAEAAGQALSDVTAQKASLEAACQDLQAQLQELQTAVDQESQQRVEAGVKNAQLTEQCAILQEQLLELQAAQASVANAKEALEQEHLQLTHSHKTLVDELQTMKDDAELVTAKMQKLAFDSNEKQGALDTARGQLKRVEAELDRLKSEVGAGAWAKSDAHSQGFTQRLQALEGIVEDKDRELVEKDQAMRKRQKEMDQMRSIINKQVDEIKALKEAREAAAAHTHTHSQHAHSQPLRFASPVRGLDQHNSSFAAHDNELRRVSQHADRLSKDVIQKDSELREALSALKKKEGELAGLKMSFESVKSEVREMRAENDRLSEERMSDQQIIRTLKGQVEAMKAFVNHGDTKPTAGTSRMMTTSVEPSTSAMSDRVSHLAMKDLQKMITSLQVKYGATIKGKGIFDADQPDLSKVVTNLQTSVAEVLSKMQDELRAKERELANVRSGSASYSSLARTLPTTPFRGSSPYRGGSPVRMNPAAAAAVSAPPIVMEGAGLVTPTKKPDLAAEDPSAWSGLRGAASKFSPSAALRLKDELSKEKKRLHSMEDEHTELLGLLAQQEVELSAYRNAFKQKVGENEATSVDKEVRENVTKLYGTYSNYRK